MSPSPFVQASTPINLLKMMGMPPTVAGVPISKNSRGMNRSGKLNTNTGFGTNTTPEAQIVRHATSLQTRKK